MAPSEAGGGPFHAISAQPPLSVFVILFNCSRFLGVVRHRRGMRLRCPGPVHHGTQLALPAYPSLHPSNEANSTNT